MNRTLFFDTVMCDSEPIDQRTTYTFFQANQENEESITTLSEQQALHWLIEKPIFRKYFIHRFFSDPKKVKTYYETVHPFTAPDLMPGDIDLIMVDPVKPHESIAFECKKVKVVAKGLEMLKINKLTSIEHGIKQANAYQTLGFHQTYLVILLLDDGRSLNLPNPMFHYNKAEPLEVIYNIPFHKSLHPDVGVIYLRINQMTGKHYNHSASLGFCIDKRAGLLEQNTKMINKIRELTSHDYPSM